MEKEMRGISKNAKNLLLFIVIILVGLSSIITGFVLDKVGRDTFVPEDIYKVSMQTSFDNKNYYSKEGDSYTMVTPEGLDLYVKVDDSTYQKSTENNKFSKGDYYTYDSVNTSYTKVSPESLNLFTKSQTKYSTHSYIYALEIIGAIIFLLSFGYLYQFLQAKFNLKKMTIKQMAVIAIFGSLSVILYYYAKFNLPFFPSWLDIQFSDVPALLTTFMYGPWSGVLVIVVRFFCKLPGTSTVGVGELADLLIGVTLVLVAGYIYKKKRTMKGAILAMGIGMLSATAMATLANWTILIPAYKYIAGYKQSDLNYLMGMVFGGSVTITDESFMAYYLLVGVIPFNLFRYTLVFAITFLLYKRLKMVIVHFVGDFKDEKKDEIIEIENNDINEDATI